MVSPPPAFGLGCTTDPEALIPGSLPALRADIDELLRRSEDAATTVEDISRRHVPGWSGAAATACNERRMQQVDALTMVSDLYRIVATVLAGHAETLVWARARAQVAVELWQQGQALDAAAQPGVAPPFSHGGLGQPGSRLFGESPGAGLAQQAQAVLATARHEVHLSGVAAAAVMDEMSDGLPDGRFDLGEFLGGVGDWVGGLAESVWMFNSVRWAIDPTGTAADAEELLRGLWDTGAHILENPDDAVPILLDTQTLHDNPGRWWGRMFPDLALTAVGGAGIATRISGIFRRGAVVAENLADAPSPALPALAQSKIAMYQQLIDLPGSPE